MNVKSHVGRKNVKAFKARQAREFRRTCAEERQAHYDSLSLEERLALAKSRPGNSLKEVTRLSKKIHDAAVTAREAGEAQEREAVKREAKKAKASKK